MAGLGMTELETLIGSEEVKELVDEEMQEMEDE